MNHASAGAHHLNISRGSATLISHGILMGDRARPNVGHDLHIAVRVRRETALGGDLVVVPNANPSPSHAVGVVIAREREMVAGVEPTVVGMAEAVEGADIDHKRKMGRGALALKCHGCDCHPLNSVHTLL